MLSSKTLPGPSLRAKSLTAPPHPTLSPMPAGRDLARRLDSPSLLPPPSLPFPSESHPSALYLSTYLPTTLLLPLYLSIYLSMYLCIYLSIYLPNYLSIFLSIYLSTRLPIYLPPSRLLPCSCPPPGPQLGLVYKVPLPIRFPRPFFFLLFAPSPPRCKPRFSSVFLFFYANQAGLEPVTSLFAKSLPIQCLWQLRYPGSVTNSMFFLYFIRMQIKFLPLIGC